VYFLAVNASLRLRNNVSGVYLVQVSLLANFTPTPEETDQYSATLLVQDKQQANPLFYQ
jgi:hypothetical protein